MTRRGQMRAWWLLVLLAGCGARARPLPPQAAPVCSHGRSCVITRPLSGPEIAAIEAESYHDGDLVTVNASRPGTLASVARLRWIRRMYLTGETADLDALAALPQLADLTLFVSSPGHLPPLPALRGLELACGGRGEAWHQVGAQPALERLALVGCPGAIPASVLAALPRLHTVSGLDVRQGSLDGLRQARALTTLSLHVGRAVDLAPLAALGQLRTLTLTSDDRADFAALAALTQLTQLRLLMVPIARLDDIAALPITELSLYGSSSVTDFTPLARMTALRVLDLSGTHIADLRPLIGLPLEDLDLAWTPARSLAPLAHIASLRHVVVSPDLPLEEGGALMAANPNVVVEIAQETME